MIILRNRTELVIEKNGTTRLPYSLLASSDFYRCELCSMSAMSCATVAMQTVCNFNDGEPFLSRAYSRNIIHSKRYNTQRKHHRYHTKYQRIQFNHYSLLSIRTGSDSFDLIENGTLRLKMKHAEAHLSSATMLVYVVFGSVLDMNKDHQIVLDRYM